ncbi:MAG: hypothetical protein HY864_09795 [Chloroflexi bacterium]|nr:hypothetical protein [Chloroflexota bacterium]
MTEDTVTTFFIGRNFKAWVAVQNGIVLDVDIVEYKLTPAERHEVICRYRQANRKKMSKQSRLLFRGAELLEGEP